MSSDINRLLWGTANTDNVLSGTVHAKYAVFDRVVSLVGSHNLDPRSEKLNSETAIIYESRPLSERLAELFYGNDLVFSKRILVGVVFRFLVNLRTLELL